MNFDKLVSFLTEPTSAKSKVIEICDGTRISLETFKIRKEVILLRKQKILSILSSAYSETITAFVDSIPASYTPIKVLVKMLKWRLQSGNENESRYRSLILDYVTELYVCCEELRKNEMLVEYPIIYQEISYPT